jgi:competence protein ComEC
MWILCSATAWLVGLLWLFSLEQLPDLGWSLATLIASALVLLGLIVWCRYADRGSPTARWLAWAGVWCWIVWAAVGIGVWHSKERLSQRLPVSVQEVTQPLAFEVLDLPALINRGRGLMRFEAVVRSPGEREGARLWMIWPLPFDRTAGVSLPLDVRPGQVWQADVRLRTPVGQRNFYGFDLETWLFQKGIALSGVVKTDRSTPMRLTMQPSLQGRLDHLRYEIRERIRVSLSEAPYWGVMAGLVVGDQGAISTDDWRVFSMTGISHLVSISGMHVTMFALLARWLVGAVWRLLSRPPLRLGLWLPAPPVMAVAGALAATGYALLAGFNIPAQRTAVMVTVVSIGLLFGAQSQPWRMLALTLLIVLGLDPTAVLAPGFWLSFVAVAILFAQPSGLSAWRSAVQAQLAISLALAPLTMLLFQQVSLVGPLANALAIPVVTFLVTPLAMAGSLLATLGWDGPLTLGHWVFAQLQAVMVWMSERSWASLRWHAPPVWAVVLACLGFVAMLHKPLGRWRWVTPLLALGLFLGKPPPPAHGEFELHAFDVGQGSALLVRTREQAVLFDTGPSMGASHAAERVIAAQLAGLGLRRLSGLMVSHQDDDHASGAQWLADHFHPDWILASLPEHFALRDWTPCRAGQSWQWDGVVFRVIHPFMDQADDHRGRNEDSCVLLVEDQQGRRLVLTGDIPKAQELEILERQPWLVRDEPLGSMPSVSPASNGPSQMILVAAHHGSRGSSGQAWVSGLAPRWLVVQAGYRNRFGHPTAEVLERAQASGAQVLRTDLQGGLQMRWRDGGWQVRQAQAETRRFWHVER